MWDSVPKLNRAADTFLALAALLVLYALVRFAIHHPVFAVSELKVTGEAARVDAAQVQALVKHELRGTFFTMDIVRLRNAFEKLPWVRRADVRRQWPNGLEVVLEEHKLLARWGVAAVGQWVNVQGEVFGAVDTSMLPGGVPTAFPLLNGPEGSSMEVAAYYGRLTEQFQGIGRKPVEVQLSPRRAWLVKLDDGMRLELGRNDTHARLERFLAAYPSAIVPLKRRIEYVDLRYANGFAVRVPGLKDVVAAPGKQGA